jgi:hypothetical protein
MSYIHTQKKQGYIHIGPLSRLRKAKRFTGSRVRNLGLSNDYMFLF